MRFLVKAAMPNETANALIKSGALGKTMDSIMADLKPEAAYFVEDGGKRTAYLFINISEPSQIPAVAEPLFLALNASVEFHPAMKPEDLMKAMPDLERAAKKYG